MPGIHNEAVFSCNWLLSVLFLWLLIVFPSSFELVMLVSWEASLFCSLPFSLSSVNSFGSEKEKKFYYFCLIMDCIYLQLNHDIGRQTTSETGRETHEEKYIRQYSLVSFFSQTFNLFSCSIFSLLLWKKNKLILMELYYFYVLAKNPLYHVKFNLEGP